jgi:voltage-gated potassium channel
MKKIAVFGYSVMSLEVMGRLNQGQFSIVFAAQNEAEAMQVNDQGFASKIIDFRNDDELKVIGVGVDVDILLCFFPKDSDNIFLTISARAMSEKLSIIAIVDDPEAAEKLLAAGANKIIDPYEICGRKTYDILTKPDITNIMDNTVFGRHDLHMAEITIPLGSYLEKTLTNSLALHEKHNLLLIGVVDKELGDELHFAIGEQTHTLDTGDVLVVLGSALAIKAFKEKVEEV